jgi:branched-chain amino acid transport system permease protein
MRRKMLARLADPRIVLAVIATVGASAEYVSSSTLQLWSFVLVNMLIAQSINVLTGIAGQISIGHAGFLSIGAYGSALMVQKLGLPLPLSILFAVIATAFAGWLLSFAVGRVKELYLAMMTLGFGMIMYELVREWSSLTGGVAGLSGIPSAALGSLTVAGVQLTPVRYFQAMLAVSALVFWLLGNFIRSSYGRAFFAIQASEVAAGSIGIPRADTKRRAYMLSAALIGLAGAFYSHLVGYLGPETFDLNRSVEALVMAIIGGLGTLLGPVLGAVVFTYLPERLQLFAEYQFMVYGALLLFSFILLPRGLAGLVLPRPRYIAIVRTSTAAATTSQPARPRPSGDTKLLEIEQLSISFMGLKALDSVSIDVKAGQLLGLIGPNGSGKSTFVNVVSGLYQPGSGRILFEGRRIDGLSDDKVARLGIIRTFQDPRLIRAFSVRENVLMGAHRLYSTNPALVAIRARSAMAQEQAFLTEADRLIEQVGLSQVTDLPVRELTYGDQRMTELARALLARPRLVLLDEPAAGLSEGEIARLEAVLRSLKDSGVSVILIDHHMEFLQGLVDEVIVLDSGKVIYRGPMGAMYADPTVVEAYLGSSDKEWMQPEECADA